MNLKFFALNDHTGSCLSVDMVENNLIQKKIDVLNIFHKEQLKATGMLRSYTNDYICQFSLIIQQLRDKAVVGCVVFSETAECFYLNCWILQLYQKLDYFNETIYRLVRFIFEHFMTKKIVINLSQNDLNYETCISKIGFTYDKEHILKTSYNNEHSIKTFFLERKKWEATSQPTLFIVAAALINNNGHILIAKRPDQKPMAGLWEFPGGKVLKGELPEIALARELREELNIDITESCLAPFSFVSHTYDSFHLLMPLYLCRIWRGSIKNKIHLDLKWVDPQCLRDYPMPPANLTLISMLQDFL